MCFALAGQLILLDPLFKFAPGKLVVRPHPLGHLSVRKPLSVDLSRARRARVTSRSLAPRKKRERSNGAAAKAGKNTGLSRAGKDFS